MTTDTPGQLADEGGEAPCYAHLLEGEPADVDDARLAALVRGMADAVLIADRNGEIVFWNDACTRLFGWPATEAVGAHLDLIIPERLRDRHWDGWRHVIQTGVTKYGDQLLEVPAAHRDGRRLSIAFTVSLLTADDGAVTGVAAVIRDDTERWQERRAVREELTALRAERDRERGATPSGAGATAAGDRP